jgi:7-carboxy-7-deazaguanine synthase
VRVDEIYESIQGEGPRVGMRTVFIRFAGCNLRCPGWPCDTQHAIDPKLYRHEWMDMSVDDIVEEVNRITNGDNRVNICLTGGEPFLQKHEDLDELTQYFNNRHYLTECFSNGTLIYPEWAYTRVCFIMDWKLPGSGEAAVGTKERVRNYFNLSYLDAVKFVIKDEADYFAAKDIYKEHMAMREMRPEIYYGVVWGALSNDKLTKWVMNDGLPWRLNVQMHNYIYNRDDRGI